MKNLLFSGPLLLAAFTAPARTVTAARFSVAGTGKGGGSGPLLPTAGGGHFFRKRRAHFSFRRGLLLAAYLTFAALTGWAQTVNTIRFTPSLARAQPYGTFQAAPGGGWWVGGGISFGNDSAWQHVARLGADLQMQRTRQGRPLGRQGTYTFRALAGGLAYAANATLGASIVPVVGCLDTATLAPRWGVRMTNTTLVTKLVAQGADTVGVYMIRRPTSSFITHLVRAWTDVATGTRWRGREVVFPRNQSPRVDGITVEGRRGVQYAYGRNFINSGGNTTFLIKLDTTKVHWERQIQPGVNDDLDLDHVSLAANGDLLALFSTQIYVPAVLPDETILARFDTAGTLLSARRITATGRFLRLSSLVELPGGEVVLAGSWRLFAGGTPHPFIVRLNAAGNVVWARRWDLGTSSGGAGATIIQRASGRYALGVSDGSFVELDASFNACQFVAEPAGAVVATPGALTITPQTLAMTPFTPTFTPEPLLNRSLTFTRAVVCTAVGVEEEATAETATFTVWPQPLPRGAALHLALPSGWNAAETQLTLFSALGQPVWRGTAAEAETTPPSLPAGVWTLRATNPRGQQQHQRLLTE